MGDLRKFFELTSKISRRIFISQELRKKNGRSERRFIKLSFILADQLFKQTQKLSRKKRFKHLSNDFLDVKGTLKHFDPKLSKQKLKTISYEELLSRYHFSLKKISCWKLSLYTRLPKEIRQFLNIGIEETPAILKSHCIAPIKKGRELFAKAVQREKLSLGQTGGSSSPSSVSPI